MKIFSNGPAMHCKAVLERTTNHISNDTGQHGPEDGIPYRGMRREKPDKESGFLSFQAQSAPFINMEDADH